jgi:hypothetical protein
MNINTHLAFAADSAAEQPGIQTKNIKEFEKTKKLTPTLNGESDNSTADTAKTTKVYYQQ